MTALKELAVMRHAWIISYPTRRRPPWWRPLARRAWRRTPTGQATAACFCGWEETFDRLEDAQAAVEDHTGLSPCWGPQTGV